MAKQKKKSSKAKKNRRATQPPQKISNDHIARLLSQAGQFGQQGQLNKVEEICQKILKSNPNHVEALHLMGLAALQKGQYSEAVNLLERALTENERLPQVQGHIGIAYWNLGLWEKGIVSYRKAVELAPGAPQFHYNLAKALAERGDESEAEEHYRKALELAPRDPVIYNNLGNLLQDTSRVVESIKYYQNALKINPRYAEAHYNLASALIKLEKQQEAVQLFQQAININPGYAEAWNNLGTVFQAQGRFKDALVCYQKALGINPQYPDALDNIGRIFDEQGKPLEAIEYYRKALRASPGFEKALGQLVYQLQGICAWDEWKESSKRLDEATHRALDNGTEVPESPFMILSRHPDPALNLAVAESHSRMIAQKAQIHDIHFSFEKRRAEKDRITIGYLSNDFRNHPVAHLALGLFREHDRKKFCVNAYSYGIDDGSHYRRRVERDSDRFVDLRNISDIEAARIIHDDQVDILVDFMGHTKGARLGICALKPAPIQVTYLGFPGTSGAGFFDYLITDKVVTPEKHEAFYSEKLVFMPHSYQINDSDQLISGTALSRAECNLPDDGFIFCSFCTAYKIEPVMFSVWMDILKAVQPSVLWLLGANEPMVNNLRHEAHRKGVSPERLIFAGRLPKDRHLRRHQLADISLDTLVYNGHTTTSDSLWAGVPVITIIGPHFASRVSASLLSAIGFPDLITNSLDEYKNLAIGLAQEPDRLMDLKQRLWNNRSIWPLFNTSEFVRYLEKAYFKMWEIHQEGLGPRKIDVY